ncbi:APC family permease [Rhodopirellula europaea]|uniref:APC family permease n=1 Tax=Rhodopirellula europaea TaxID=1263866 RepID=UPI003D2D9180
MTNSGSEIKEPKKNIGRSIIWSLSICLVVYLLVALAVSGNLSVSQIIEHRDYALSKASEPAFGQWGRYFIVGLAIIATISGLLASTFAVSRMLAMLSEMKLVPHKHFGVPGDIQKHTLVYTIVIAIALTIFFDLGRYRIAGSHFLHRHGHCDSLGRAAAFEGRCQSEYRHPCHCDRSRRGHPRRVPLDESNQ